ncbi:hypothetical protein M8C21_025660 [Ambrosia artemisiifolia]|uniref:Mediator of RNA polymerase II transcription subunit 19a n=1 Tax=Ambrosia artemisiifolia TaxID=4212 RepID=A0AAD5D6G2_AMBAR|nr:hypothetical protein M8C21_025660 [Ambrosia artemisiifolia]
MDPETKNFGKGPRELTGAVDLISYYKLLPHYELFCKKSLPLSISDTHYLHDVVGDTDIRKGEGMQLDQLIHNTSLSRDTTNTRIQPFDINNLAEAFRLRETTTPIDLPSSEKGMPTIAGKSRSESKDKEKKHKKHKDRDREKDKEHKKHKHRHKDPSKDKKSSHHDKKRKHDGNEDVSDIHKQKKSKHKSKIDEIGAIKIAA